MSLPNNLLTVKLVILGVAALIAVFGFSNRKVRAFTSGPPASYTGAPGESNCTVCHFSFEVNSGSGAVTITGLPANYSPGQQVAVTVTVSQMGASKYGFQLTALNDNGMQAGTLVVTDAPNTQLVSGTVGGSLRSYIEHTEDGTIPVEVGQRQWTFTWTAPETSVGPVTFYAVGNGANGDSDLSGDYIYTSSVTILPVESPTSGLQYYPLPNPVRLLDTRPGQPACDTPGTPLTGNATRTEAARIACTGIPSSARVVVGNATVVNIEPGATGGFITLYPSGAAQPTVSNLNYVAGQVVPNAFTVALGSGDGAFNIFATSSTHFIVDVTGYYAPPGVGGLFYHPLPNPIRLLDTRPGQSACDAPATPLVGGASRIEAARIPCTGIPSSAQVVVGNATVVNTEAGASSGFITLYPSGAAQPTVSNLNYVAGQVVPNAFTVALGSGDGAFQIFASSSTHFIVDITGYYSDQATDSNGAGLLYYPLPNPVRLLDTRPGEPACDTPGAPLAGNATRTEVARTACSGVAASAQAIVGNATVVNTVAGATGGFITLYPSSASQPNASNLNYVAGQIVPNSFTVGLGNGDGAFKIFASSSTHFIADLTGYFAP